MELMELTFVGAAGHLWWHTVRRETEAADSIILIESEGHLCKRTYNSQEAHIPFLLCLIKSPS